MAIAQGFNVFKGLINKLPKGKKSKIATPEAQAAEAKAAQEAAQFGIPTVGAMPTAASAAAPMGTLGKTGKFFFGGPKRTAATIIGGAPLLPLLPAGIISGGKGYLDILKSAYGMGGEPQEQGITDLELQRGAYSPFGASQGMNPQDLLATINAFAQGMPAPAGGGGAGQRSVYETGSAKAQRALGFQPTSTSSLSPMAGGEALAAQALTNQRGSLQDYLNMVSSAANAAGVKLDQASRQQLVNLGLAAYIEDMQNQNKQAEALQYLPQFIVTPEVRRAAEMRVEQTPGLTLQDAVNELKQRYIYDLLSQQNSR
jgi:hypothetical protein